MSLINYSLMYLRGQKCKRRPADLQTRVVEFMELQFCQQPANTDRTPYDETVLLQAGLGRRTINIAEEEALNIDKF